MNVRFAIIIGIVLVIAVAIVGFMVVEATGSVVANGDVVQVNYTGTLTNGTVFDSSAGRAPLTFTVGSGQVISGFNNAVIGMKVGEEKSVTLPPSEAYGEVNPALIINVPRTQFGNQSIEAGMEVSTTANGQQVSGKVTAVNATNVTVDFNPALAGQTLIFKITVVAIQKG